MFTVSRRSRHGDLFAQCRQHREDHTRRRHGGAHVRYIARPDACSHLDSEHFPVADLDEAPAWIDRQEALDRKNARVLDKVRIALRAS
jgi:hypothetical protein